MTCHPVRGAALLQRCAADTGSLQRALRKIPDQRRIMIGMLHGIRDDGWKQNVVPKVRL